MPEHRLYANRQHLSHLEQPFLSDLCRALWKEEPLDIRIQRYGSRASFFVAVESPEESDIWILPAVWNDYLEQGQVSLAAQEAQNAAQTGRRLVVFSQGDFAARLPFSNVVLFERSTYASQRNAHGNCVYAMPAFIPDYLHQYCDGQVQVREKGVRPVVGFCGQAGGSWLDFTRRECMIRWWKLQYGLGWRKWEPPPYETTRLRKRVLNEVGKHVGLQTNFLTRNRYRAGYLPAVKDPFHPTRMEFIGNILDSDYTVCVRGGGNFSVRFYETLALGRIPVFINTDCSLPFDDTIDYRQYCIWVEEDQIPQIGEMIVAFHQALSPVQFRDLQFTCYDLWRERLSMDGFYKHLMEHSFDGAL